MSDPVTLTEEERANELVQALKIGIIIQRELPDRKDVVRNLEQLLESAESLLAVLQSREERVCEWMRMDSGFFETKCGQKTVFWEPECPCPAYCFGCGNRVGLKGVHVTPSPKEKETP